MALFTPESPVLVVVAPGAGGLGKKDEEEGARGSVTCGRDRISDAIIWERGKVCVCVSGHPFLRLTNTIVLKPGF